MTTRRRPAVRTVDLIAKREERRAYLSRSGMRLVDTHHLIDCDYRGGRWVCAKGCTEAKP